MNLEKLFENVLKENSYYDRWEGLLKDLYEKFKSGEILSNQLVPKMVAAGISLTQAGKLKRSWQKELAKTKYDDPDFWIP